MLKQPAFIPLPPPPLPPPGIAPLPPTIGRQPRNDPMAVTPTSIRIFNTKKVKTKPKQTNTNYFDENKHRIKEIQEQTMKRIRALTEKDIYQRPQTDNIVRRYKKEQQNNHQDIIYDDFAQDVNPEQLTITKPVQEIIQPQKEDKKQIEPIQSQKDDTLQQESIKVTTQEELPKNDEETYMNILNKYKKRGKAAVKAETFEDSEGFNNLNNEAEKSMNSSMCSNLDSDEELEGLLRFVENRKDGEELLTQDELQKLKQKVDEKYQKQNTYQETVGPQTFNDVQAAPVITEARQTYQKQMAGINGLGGLQSFSDVLDLKNSQPGGRVREYYDIADIELESTAIRNKFQKRQHETLVTAPHLQPFVFRAQ